MINLLSLIRDVPDFPKKGIVFKDITPLLASPQGLALAVELMVNPYRGRGVELVIGAESRGFIFGTAIAQALSAGFVPIRKPGKLPSEKVSLTYDLEYGQDTLEIHKDAIRRGAKCLVVDDLLATGGTMRLLRPRREPRRPHHRRRDLYRTGLPQGPRFVGYDLQSVLKYDA